MDHQRLVLRIGAGVVAFAMAVRLFGGGSFAPLANLLQRNDVLSFLVYLQTGRLVSYSRLPSGGTALDPPLAKPPSQAETGASQPETLPALPTLPPFTLPIEPEPTRPPPQTELRQPAVFSAADLACISVRYSCDYRPDLQSLLLSPLGWELRGDAPTVLIVHTHATESYTKAPGETYEESGSYRTLDENYNMVSIGDEIARILTGGGVSVLHDRSIHDYPSYNGSYASSRTSVQEYLARYPSIRLVLDIHRDAAGNASTGQLDTSATVNGQESAQLMLVVGTDAGGSEHPDWQSNLSLALKLNAQLERMYPGLCRPLDLRDARFNADLCPGSLLVEVGAAGNSRQEALIAARALAEGVLALSAGAVTADSTT